MSEPLLVEIIAYAPTAFYHCTHCEVAWREMGKSNKVHEEQVESSLPADLQQDYAAVSDWVKDLFRMYCDRIVIKVVDAASIEGVFKTLRYKTHRYPAIIVNKASRFTGLNSLPAATDEINHFLVQQGGASTPAGS